MVATVVLPREPRALDMQAAADRIEALGGSLTVRREGRHTLEARVPVPA